MARREGCGETGGEAMAVTVSYTVEKIDQDYGFQANTWEDGASDTPDALGLSNGGFVVAYNVSNGSGGAGAIALEFYDADWQLLNLIEIEPRILTSRAA